MICDYILKWTVFLSFNWDENYKYLDPKQEKVIINIPEVSDNGKKLYVSLSLSLSPLHISISAAQTYLNL